MALGIGRGGEWRSDHITQVEPTFFFYVLSGRNEEQQRLSGGWQIYSQSLWPASVNHTVEWFHYIFMNHWYSGHDWTEGGIESEKESRNRASRAMEGATSNNIQDLFKGTDID